MLRRAPQVTKYASDATAGARESAPLDRVFVLASIWPSYGRRRSSVRRSLIICAAHIIPQIWRRMTLTCHCEPLNLSLRRTFTQRPSGACTGRAASRHIRGAWKFRRMRTKSRALRRWLQNLMPIGFVRVAVSAARPAAQLAPAPGPRPRPRPRRTLAHRSHAAPCASCGADSRRSLCTQRKYDAPE